MALIFGNVKLADRLMKHTYLTKSDLTHLPYNSHIRDVNELSAQCICIYMFGTSNVTDC